MGWFYYIEEKGRDLAALGSKEAYDHKGSPIIYYNGCNYIGGLAEYLDWVAKKYEYEDETPLNLYEQVAKKEYDKYLQGLGYQYVYFDIAIGEEKPQRVTFQLFNDVCEKTCENFRALCTGEKGTAGKTTLHYKGNKFHRIVKNGWVQAGDIVTSDCAGDGSQSIYGGDGLFPDECFAHKMDSPGILAMANNGANSNGSQFFISLRSLDWLDAKAVAFGRVISGMDVIRDLGATDTQNERPIDDCVIVDCGQTIFGATAASQE